MATVYWRGTRVRLRAVEPSDGAAHFEWNQDADTFRALDRVYFPQSQVAAMRWAERASLPDGGSDAFHFEIETIDGELAGVIATHNCDPRNGTFAYGVAIREAHQRQGYASEAIELVLRYYFQELRYQKATVHIYSFNNPSIVLHERLGFQREGCMRRMIFTEGQFFDILLYGITREEFTQRHTP